jgi:non-canonical purine NTP pyrophosphatase (RdgB/HAM1 family)
MLERVLFVTSSEHKHREAQAILQLTLERVAVDLPEPQGMDVVAIARAKAREAQHRLGAAVLIEDTSLELAALGGFPGPLVRWLMDAAGPGALARMLDGFADRSATARCIAVLFDGEGEWLGEGVVAGQIADRPRGVSGFGWDVVFVPDWDGHRTFAEMSAEEKNARSHRSLAFRRLARALPR